jgi:hypothetical protein
MPNWTPSLRRAHRDEQNGYIIFLLWSSGAEDITFPIYYGMLTSSRRQHPISPRTDPQAGPTSWDPLAAPQARQTGVNA